MIRPIITILTLLIASRTSAQKWDKTFNGSGWVNENITSDAQTINYLVVQPDKKLLAVGMCLDDNDQYQPFVIRYEKNGSRDNNFGSGGLKKLSFHAAGIQTAVAAINSDGLIYIAASRSGGDGPIFLQRLKTDGTPDSQFGNGGLLKDSIGTGPLDDEHVTAIAVQPDKKILVVGTLFTVAINRTDVWVIRYNEDGSRDQDFGVNGLAKFNPYQEYYSSGTNNKDIQTVNRILLLSGGRILLGGKFRSYTQQKEDFMLVRVHANGTLDKSFGAVQQGVVFVGMQDIEQVTGMALQKDSSIVFGGPCGNGYTRIRLIRIKADGTSDPTFGTQVTSTGNWGYTTFDLQQYANQGVSDMVVMPDDKIMIGGYNGTNMLVVYRFSKNGVIDSTYGKNGRVDSSFGQQGQACNRIALDNASGRLYVAGWVAGNGSSNCYVAAVKVGESTGVRDIAAGRTLLHVYPNPASERIELSLPEKDDQLSVSVYNASGQCIIVTDQRQLDISALPGGIYFLRLDAGDTIYSARLVIQH